MKVFLLLFAIFVASITCYETKGDGSIIYTDSDISSIKDHINCYLDKGSCDEVAQNFKQYFPDAMETACGRCSEKNKQGTWAFIQAGRKYFPAEMEEFKNKWDPTGKNWDNLVKTIQPGK